MFEIGKVMLSDRQLFQRHIGKPSANPLNLEIVRASGVWMYGPSGEKYLDLAAGISVSYLGHNHPVVVAAVQEQAARYMHLMVYGEYVQSPQVRLAGLLARNLPETLDSVYFVNSGSEAIEGAMKLARRYTGRTESVAFKNAYHGSTQGALSIMGAEQYKQAFRPLLPDIRLIDFNDVEALDLISEKTACVVAEPVQGEAGIVLPAESFLQKLREKCNETGALLVFDEVQTGFCRTGPLFAFQETKTIPDILVLAKGLGCGMPLGAFISSSSVMQSLSHDPALGHITTFGGHPVSCAAGLAGLEVLLQMKDSLMIHEKEMQIRKALSHPMLREIRGRGLMLAAELGEGEVLQKFVRKAIEKGVVTDWFLFNDTSFRISPPLIITPEEIEWTTRRLAETLDELK